MGRLATPSSWMVAGGTCRGTVVFQSMGKGLRERQRRVVNGKGTRITPLVSHGIKSRVAEILKFPVYPD